jgi:threonine aldolase
VSTRIDLRSDTVTATSSLLAAAAFRQVPAPDGVMTPEQVLVNVVGDRVRFVTHRDVSTSDIESAAEAWGRIGDG